MSDGMYERARGDAALRARLTAAYRGGGDLMDALWWYAHPDSPTPEGRPAPLARIRELEARLYSRDSRPESADDDAATLEQLRATLRRDRDAVGCALAATCGQPVEAHPSSGPDVLDPTAPSRSAPLGGGIVARDRDAADAHDAVRGDDDHAPAERPEQAEQAERAERPAARRRPHLGPRRPGLLRCDARPRWAVPAASAAVGLLLGAVLGAGVSTALGGDPLAALGGSAAVGASEAPALAVFDAPQSSDDRPDQLYSSRLDPQSLRYLGPPAPVYAARDADGRACLVLVQDDGGYTADCVTAAGFPATGLEVSGVYRMPDPVVSGDGSSADPSSVDATSSTANEVFADVDALWLPDGTVHLEQEAHVVGPEGLAGSGDDPDSDIHSATDSGAGAVTGAVTGPAGEAAP